MSTLFVPKGTAAHRSRFRPAYAFLLWPGVMLLGFLAIPLFLLFRVSFAHIDPTRYEGSGFTFDSFVQLAQPMVINAITFSVMLSVLVSLVCVVITFPATYLITKLGRKAQIAWIMGFLSTLALSEVLITFAWQIILSKKFGLSEIAVLLGFIDKPVSLAPSFGGVVACIVYLVIPFNFLTFYPPLSRLDPSYMEAARTLGASPARAFFQTLLPLMRRPIATSFFTTIVMTIGAYSAPLIIGGPSNWTIGVVISELAVGGQNLPLAAAISILLMVVSICLVWVVARLGGKGHSS